MRGDRRHAWSSGKKKTTETQRPVRSGNATYIAAGPLCFYIYIYIYIYPYGATAAGPLRERYSGGSALLLCLRSHSGRSAQGTPHIAAGPLCLREDVSSHVPSRSQAQAAL